MGARVKFLWGIPLFFRDHTVVVLLLAALMLSQYPSIRRGHNSEPPYLLFKILP